MRDTAATMDLVGEKYVEREDYQTVRLGETGNEQMLGQPRAKVTVKGPFGVLETVAVVSKGLLKGHSYLFSNSSKALLNAQGSTFLDMLKKAPKGKGHAGQVSRRRKQIAPASVEKAVKRQCLFAYFGCFLHLLGHLHFVYTLPCLFGG